VSQREKRCVLELKGAVERAGRIAEARDVGEPEPIEPSIRFFRLLHVHERHLRSKRKKICAHARDVFERLATERSPEVAEEDQQQRPAIRERANRGRHRYAVVTAVCAHFSSLRASS
jgi:hypothetical protein